MLDAPVFKVWPVNAITWRKLHSSVNPLSVSNDPLLPTGGLDVTVAGLPPNIRANVLVVGPQGFESTIQVSQTLKDLVLGNYTIRAESVSAGEALYLPDPALQTAIVEADSLTAARVDHVFVGPPVRVEPDSLPFTAMLGTGESAEQVLLIVNTTAQALQIMASSDSSWIIVRGDTDRTIDASDTARVLVSVPKAGQMNGIRLGFITISSDWWSTRIPVTASTVPRRPSIVTVQGRQLLLQTRRSDASLSPLRTYRVHGVNWSPASKTTNTNTADPDNAKIRRPEFQKWVGEDGPLLQDMNVNTVRVPIDFGVDHEDLSGLSVMDSLSAFGIMVIMTVDDGINNMERVAGAVGMYKDHPALLMWMIGSEWNINRYFGVATSVLDAAQRTEEAAALVKSLDTYHPVATSYGDINVEQDGMRLPDTQRYVNQVATSVDVWALNVYRGPTFGSLFDEWRLITDKPMLIGEFGTDAYRTTNYPPLLCPGLEGVVDEDAQATWNLGLWNDLSLHLSDRDQANVAIGGLVHEWTDQWWKTSPTDSGLSNMQENCGHDANPSGHPDNVANEEYFGLVDIERDPRRAYGVLRDAFASKKLPARR